MSGNTPLSVEYDVDKYTNEELLEILEIAEPTKENIIAACERLRTKFKEENRSDLVSFFDDVETNLLAEFPDENNEELVNQDNEYNPQNTSDNQLHQWWSEQALTQDDVNESNKSTERNQRIDIYDNVKNVMNRERLGVANNYGVPVIQGQMNPNLKNITTRIVNIDSQFRQNSLPAKNGLAYNDIVNPHTSTYSSTDYTLSLTDTLKQVLSLKLYSVSIPYAWYNIDSTYYNNFFAIVMDETTYTITIPSGNYLSQTAKTTAYNNIYSVINQAIYSTLNIKTIGFGYDELTGKTIFLNKSNSTVKLIWYSASSEELSATDADFTTMCGMGAKSNSNLGFTLGFRDEEYEIPANNQIFSGIERTTTINYINESDELVSWSGTKGIMSESIVNLCGPRYLLLIVDDYNHNHLNKGLVAIQDTETVSSLPSYFDPNIPCRLVEPNKDEGTFNTYPEYGVVAETDTSNRNAVPKRLTNAQQTTINEISKDRANTTQNKLQAVTRSDMFAIIPIKKSLTTTSGEGLTEFSGPIQINERVYFGPVDISKLNVKLYTDKGNVLNLNGSDWSFSMIATTLYQY